MRNLACALAFLIASAAHAEMKDYVYLLKPARPEMVTAGPNEREKAVLSEHGAYLTRLTQDGTLYLAGRTQEADAIGIAIFRASSDQEAKKIMNGDPAVAKGIMTATLHPFRVAFLAGRP